MALFGDSRRTVGPPTVQKAAEATAVSVGVVYHLLSTRHFAILRAPPAAATPLMIAAQYVRAKLG